MDTFIGLVIFGLFVFGFLYVSNEKFKAFVDSKIPRKKPTEKPQDTIVSPIEVRVPTPVEKPVVEAPVAPQPLPEPIKPAPVRQPTVTELLFPINTTPDRHDYIPTVPGETKNFYVPPTTVELSNTPTHVKFTTPKGFKGLVKVMWVDAPSGYDGAARINVAVNGPHGLVALAQETQYTGGALSLSTKDVDYRAAGYIQGLDQDTDYDVVAISSVPTRALIQVNGTHQG